MREKNIHEIIKLLNSGFQNQKKEALYRISKLDQKIVPVIIRVLKYRRSYWVYQVPAIYILGKLGSRAVKSIPLLIDLAHDKNPDIRAEAIWALGQINPGDRNTISCLLSALDDAEEDVRFNATKSIENIGYKTEAVISKLNELYSQEIGRAHV